MVFLRVLFAVCVLLVLAALAGAWLVVPRLDPGLFRNELTEVASERLGREVRIDGPIHLELLPQPVLTASNVKLGSGKGLSITAAEMRLRVALGPLAAGRIDARELVLRGADMRVPWPFDPAAVMVRTPRWLTSVTAKIEDGKLSIGRLTFSGIDATFETGGYTGSYAANGTAELSGQPWRFSVRMTQPGFDGSAGVDVTLVGQGRAQGIAGSLSGQIGPDGTLAGRVKGSGPDLSHLLPAPAVAFKAEGRVTIAGGLAAADDLAMEIGGSPARGAVALRVTPTPRLDLALAASRLDLDAWLPVLENTSTLELPTGIDLSAEAATFYGGTLRGLRAAVDLSNAGAEVREVRAVLPGDAPIRLSGKIAPAEGPAPRHPRFEGDVTVAAPALRTTLAWVQKAGVGPIAALPQGVLRTADVSGHVVAEPAEVAVASLSGTLDGSPVSGSLTLRGGKRFVLGAGLSFDKLDLDAWLPPQMPSLAAMPARFAPFDLNLRLEAKRALFQGTTIAPLSLDAGAEAGKLTLRRLDLQVAGIHAIGSATLGAGGRLSEGRLDIQAPHAEALATLLPDNLAFLGRAAPHLWQSAANAQILGSGVPDKLGLSVTADLADLRVESEPVLDLTKHTWTATVTLRHPGAPRLVQALGVPAAETWLGDGSLGLIAQLSGAPGRVAADHFDLTAGGLRASGSLLLDRSRPRPMLSGQIAAEELPLPLPNANAIDPLPLEGLRDFDAAVKLRAGHVLAGLVPVMDRAEATLAVRNGVLRLDLTKATLSGGSVAGVATLNAGAEPPAFTLAFGINGARIARPLFDTPLDLIEGTLDAHANVTAAGHAPAALLATLAGEVSVTVNKGVLAGVDLAKAGPSLTDDELRAMLAGGATPFDALTVAAHVDRGVMTLHDAALTGPAGSVTASGAIDLPGHSLDLRIALRPPVPDPPTLGLRLSGPWDALQRAPELAEAARWRAAHPGDPPAATGAPSTRTP